MFVGKKQPLCGAILEEHLEVESNDPRLRENIFFGDNVLAVEADPTECEDPDFLLPILDGTTTEPVWGKMLSTNSKTLFLAGLSQSAVWMILTIIGIAELE